MEANGTQVTITTHAHFATRRRGRTTAQSMPRCRPPFDVAKPAPWRPMPRRPPPLLAPTSSHGAAEHNDTGHATAPPTVNIVKMVPWRSMTRRSTSPLYGARRPLRRAGGTPLKTVIWSSPSGHSFTSSRWCRRSRRRRTRHHTAHLHFITPRTTTWCSPRCLPAFKSPVTPFAHLDEPVP